jgi:hypothetical protein
MQTVMIRPCDLGHAEYDETCGWCAWIPRVLPGVDPDADPCPGCGHGRGYHANGFCTHPRSIRPCSCSGGWYR